MAGETLYILYLDDYHGGDVLFMQGLSRALARKAWKPAPVIVHGSGEHAERLMESHGIFRERSNGVLAIESAREHALVERALRGLNQKVVALLTDAVVSSVGVIGAQRNVFLMREGRIHAPGAAWVKTICDRGVVPVVAANARDEESGATGELDLTAAVIAFAREATDAISAVDVVFFTKTNLPGLMREGAPRATVSLDDPAVGEVVPDFRAVQRVVTAGLPVLLTNSNRLSDPEGPAGSRLRASL